GRHAIWCRADAQGYCRRARSRRRSTSSRAVGPLSRVRYVRIRLLSCAPYLISVGLSKLFNSVHRFRYRIISLLFVPALCSRLGGLFCGGLDRLLGLCRLCLRRRSGFSFRLWLWLALGPRCRRLGWLRSAGENFGYTNHREFVAVAALAARILAPALLER